MSSQQSIQLTSPRRSRLIAACLLGSILLAFALMLRIYDISARPFHSDEGVNFGFLNDIATRGYYPYSHLNYHGPLFFYVAYAFKLLFGDSELALRSTSIFAGSLSLLVLLGLRSQISTRFVLIAWALFAVSASHVFHSRYFIHEMLLVAGTGCAAVGALRWILARQVSGLYLIAVALTVVVTTKETWIISAVAVGTAGLAISRPRAELRSLYEQRSHIVLGLLLAYLASLAVYSACFTWFNGIVQAGLAIPQWLGRGVGDTGHFKPFYYYIGPVIAHSEPWLLVALGCGIMFEASRFLTKGKAAFAAPESADDRAVRFLLIWSLLSIIIYSSIPYKTPWLVINLTYPLTLLTAMLLEKLWKLLPTVAIVNLVIVFVLSLGSTAMLNYSVLPFALASDSPLHTRPYGRENPFSYVHTSQGMRDFIEDLERYFEKAPSARVLMAVNAYWPLPYYLRAHSKQLAYLNTSDLSLWSATYDVLVDGKCC